MYKRGSALMQVMVIGLIIAAFAVLILRYAVTRSSNLSRTDRILRTQITADSCLDQYMSFIAISELNGIAPSSTTLNMNCLGYANFTADSTSTIAVMYASSGIDPISPDPNRPLFRIVTTFTLQANSNQ